MGQHTLHLDCSPPTTEHAQVSVDAELLLARDKLPPLFVGDHRQRWTELALCTQHVNDSLVVSALAQRRLDGRFVSELGNKEETAQCKEWEVVPEQGVALCDVWLDATCRHEGRAGHVQVDAEKMSNAKETL